MVNSCAAYGCKNRFRKGLSFHRFPLQNPELLRKWLLSMRRRDFFPSRTSVVCSAHFTPDCFYPAATGYHLLKPGSVPTIFNFPAYIKTENHEVMPETHPAKLKGVQGRQQPTLSPCTDDDDESDGHISQDNSYSPVHEDSSDSDASQDVPTESRLIEADSSNLKEQTVQRPQRNNGLCIIRVPAASSTLKSTESSRTSSGSAFVNDAEPKDVPEDGGKTSHFDHGYVKTDDVETLKRKLEEAQAKNTELKKKLKASLIREIRKDRKIEMLQCSIVSKDKPKTSTLSGISYKEEDYRIEDWPLDEREWVLLPTKSDSQSSC